MTPEAEQQRLLIQQQARAYYATENVFVKLDFFERDGEWQANLRHRRNGARASGPPAGIELQTEWPSGAGDTPVSALQAFAELLAHKRRTRG